MTTCFGVTTASPNKIVSILYQFIDRGQHLTAFNVKMRKGASVAEAGPCTSTVAADVGLRDSSVIVCTLYSGPSAAGDESSKCRLETITPRPQLARHAICTVVRGEGCAGSLLMGHCLRRQRLMDVNGFVSAAHLGKEANKKATGVLDASPRVRLWHGWLKRDDLSLSAVSEHLAEGRLLVNGTTRLSKIWAKLWEDHSWACLSTFMHAAAPWQTSSVAFLSTAHTRTAY